MIFGGDLNSYPFFLPKKYLPAGAYSGTLAQFYLQGVNEKPVVMKGRTHNRNPSGATTI